MYFFYSMNYMMIITKLYDIYIVFFNFSVI